MVNEIFIEWRLADIYFSDDSSRGNNFVHLAWGYLRNYLITIEQGLAQLVSARPFVQELLSV